MVYDTVVDLLAVQVGLFRRSRDNGHICLFLYECSPGVAALGERNLANGKREGEFKGELKKLRNAREGHQKKLETLQREARANASYSADIQV